MDWEQKFDALSALGNTWLAKDVHGNWYVHQSYVEVSDGAFLHSETGRGLTPQEAVEQHWDNHVTNLPLCNTIRIGLSDNRRDVRWNGYMWVDVPEPRVRD